MSESLNQSADKIDNTRYAIIELMDEHDIQANEALSLLSGMLVQFYRGLVENQSRDNFVSVMTQCYDVYDLIETEPEGSVH